VLHDTRRPQADTCPELHRRLSELRRGLSEDSEDYQADSEIITRAWLGYCKLPTLSDNHFAPDLRDRRPSSPRPRSGARFCACFSLPTFATGGGAFQERGMCPYLLSLKVGSLRCAASGTRPSPTSHNAIRDRHAPQRKLVLPPSQFPTRADLTTTPMTEVEELPPGGDRQSREGITSV
jgi:hypothetical protein